MRFHVAAPSRKPGVKREAIDILSIQELNTAHAMYSFRYSCTLMQFTSLRGGILVLIDLIRMLWCQSSPTVVSVRRYRGQKFNVFSFESCSELKFVTPRWQGCGLQRNQISVEFEFWMNILQRNIPNCYYTRYIYNVANNRKSGCLDIKVTHTSALYFLEKLLLITKTCVHQFHWSVSFYQTFSLLSTRPVCAQPLEHGNLQTMEKYKKWSTHVTN